MDLAPSCSRLLRSSPLHSRHRPFGKQGHQQHKGLRCAPAAVALRGEPETDCERPSTLTCRVALAWRLACTARTRGGWRARCCECAS